LKSLIVNLFASVGGADSLVKLWGKWIIQVAMGCWRLYNQSNHLEFPACCQHVLPPLTVTTGTYKNYD
jgi:hypothetical protein